MASTLFITGASSGIGEATARAAAQAGWNVALSARSIDRLQRIAGQIGERAFAVKTDVTKLASIDDAIAQAAKHFGGIDAVFANAGMGLQTPGIEQGDPEEWRRLIDLNVLGVLHTARAAMPELRKTRGQLVLTGSRAGRSHISGSIYGATKWFVHGLAGNLADEMREWGGRCTVIAPGMVNTPFFDESKPTKLQPRDVADAVVYAIGQRGTSCVREVYLMPND